MSSKGDKTGQMRRWREKNRARYNEYQKLYKRKIRGSKKVN